MAMEEKLILRKKYQIGGSKVAAWIEGYGTDDAVTAIQIHASAPTKRGANPQAGRAARELDRELTAYFAGDFGKVRFERLPLEANGSGRYLRTCMDFLKEIPRGETRTYQQEAVAVAAKLGGKPSARAAGQANKSNPFSVVVPCHRVIASSPANRLGGYMGGTKEQALSLKEALLFHEGALTS